MGTNPKSTVRLLAPSSALPEPGPGSSKGSPAVVSVTTPVLIPVASGSPEFRPLSLLSVSASGSVSVVSELKYPRRGPSGPKLAGGIRTTYLPGGRSSNR